MLHGFRSWCSRLLGWNEGLRWHVYYRLHTHVYHLIILEHERLLYLVIPTNGEILSASDCTTPQCLSLSPQMQADSSDYRLATLDSPLASSLDHATSTIDDLTLALTNFSRVPSPELQRQICCCCGSEECDATKAWLALKSKLESRLVLSAGESEYRGRVPVCQFPSQRSGLRYCSAMRHMYADMRFVSLACFMLPHSHALNSQTFLHYGKLRKIVCLDTPRQTRPAWMHAWLDC